MSLETSVHNEKRFLFIRYLLLIIISITASSLVFVLVNYRRSSDLSFTSDGKYVDLRTLAQEGDDIAVLDNCWEFYPNQLLNPQMIEEGHLQSENYPYTYFSNVQISANGWTDLGPDAVLHHALIDTRSEEQCYMSKYGFGTYRIAIQFDRQLELVSLNLPSISQSATIWVNGTPIKHFGVVAASEEQYRSSEVAANLQITPDASGRVEIVIQCANFSSAHGGILCKPCIGSDSDIDTLDISARIYLTVLVTLLYVFLTGGIYISQTFVSKSKLYFFLLMVLTSILYEFFAPTITLLSGNWNYLIRVSLIVLCNFFTFLFYFSLYPKGLGSIFDKLRFFEIAFLSLTTTLYLVTFWCFPNFLYQQSSYMALFILVLVTNIYCAFRVFHMMHYHNHGKFLYAISVILTDMINLSVFYRSHYMISVTLHGFLVFFLLLIYGTFFIVNYVRTFEALSFHNKNLQSAVDEKTKYIAKVNQDLLRNHEKLMENEETRKKMLSNVSHDLRTPITAIRGYVELMLNAKEPLSKEQEIQYLNNIHTRSTQMEQLISDLVQLTRLESENDKLDIMPISIKDMVRDLFNLYHAECEGTSKTITFQAPEDDDLLIDGDAKKLLRVFENIIVNAMKYTREDGKIQIICHRYDDPAMLDGNAVEVIVKDNGVGIPENEVPYVFDRFYRAENSGINRTGSGLGLSIVKSVMDKHGGKIWVESEEGKGSEFHIVFRASEFTMEMEEEPEDEE